MIDKTLFSPWLLKQPIAAHDAAMERILLGKRRTLNILERELVAHQKTLEQKISDQGPVDQHVDPHLLGLGIKDLLELRRISRMTHHSTGKEPWYTNRGTNAERASQKLDNLAPLYAAVSIGHFKNLVGDALEVIVNKCLTEVYQQDSKYAYLGDFKLHEQKKDQRYQKAQPPRIISGQLIQGEADFIQYGHDEGGLFIECKNYREWIYPHHKIIKELIRKAHSANLIPLLVARRFHYTTITNLLAPSGILYHQTFFQYYPADQEELAAQVREKRSLGFSDVRATETPHSATLNYFRNILPSAVAPAAQKWKAHADVLLAYACDEIPIREVYAAIGSSPPENHIPF